MANRQMVLLLHGLWMGPWAMSWLARELGEAGFETQAIALHSMSDSPETHVARLAQALAETDADRIHLVGHSLGGVIVLRYLRTSVDKRLGRALLLGTPALGCQAARQLDRQPWGALLGSSRELWFAPFAQTVPGNVEVGAIAGDHAFGLGPLFTSLDGPSDGVVTVAETRIAGLRDHIVLHVSHSLMLISEEVARQGTAFLSSAAFLR
jgi:pimeloyl-ACP methyl ester carboxylesterase